MVPLVKYRRLAHSVGGAVELQQGWWPMVVRSPHPRCMELGVHAAGKATRELAEESDDKNRGVLLIPYPFVDRTAPLHTRWRRLIHEFVTPHRHPGRAPHLRRNISIVWVALDLKKERAEVICMLSGCAPLGA